MNVIYSEGLEEKIYSEDKLLEGALKKHGAANFLAKRLELETLMVSFKGGGVGGVVAAVVVVWVIVTPSTWWW